MFLEAILAHKRDEVARREREVSLASLKEAAAANPAPRDFAAALAKSGLSVIAEVKRASPSKGPIRPDLDPAALARRYESGGAAAVSVLTDARYFGALDGDLRAVRATVSVPVLRKDFILNEYQVWESRAMGADAMLLIAAAMSPSELRRLVDLAAELGVRPLVEVHSETEATAAADSGARVIGINNRDLVSFQVDVSTTRRLLGCLPKDVVVVSESGISTPEQARAVQEWGVDAILVGEALVVSAEPEALIRRLRGEELRGSASTAKGRFSW